MHYPGFRLRVRQIFPNFDNLDVGVSELRFYRHIRQLV